MSRTLPQPAVKPGFRESFDQLKQAQKTRKGVPLYLLWVNRPAGRVVAAALRNTAVRPNHVTFAGAVLTYGSLLWLAFGAGTGISSALVGVLLALGYVLDSADGQLARLQGRSSAYGEWLDHILDNGRIAVMHVAAFCFLFRNTDHSPVLLAACTGAFLLASSTIFFGGALLDQLRRNSEAKAAAAGRAGGAAGVGDAGGAGGGAAGVRDAAAGVAGVGRAGAGRTLDGRAGSAPARAAATSAAGANGAGAYAAGAGSVGTIGAGAGLAGAGSAAGPAESRRLMRRSVIMLPVDYGMTCLAFLLLPLPGVFLGVYAVLAAAHVLMCAAFLPKWRSDLLRLG